MSLSFPVCKMGGSNTYRFVVKCAYSFIHLVNICECLLSARTGLAAGIIVMMNKADVS